MEQLKLHDMDRERADNLEMIQKMEKLILFLRGEYVRLGHPNEDEDRQLRAFINAIETVRGVITEDKLENGVPAAVRVIETAIRVRGWLRDVLTEHREASCREARELCASILAYTRQKWRLGPVLQESQNVETNSVGVLLIQLKQCGEYQFCDFRSCRLY